MTHKLTCHRDQRGHAFLTAAPVALRKVLAVRPTPRRRSVGRCPRPPGWGGARGYDVLDASEWRVQSTSIDYARKLVERWHYAAGAGNSAVYVHALVNRETQKILGVAWWQPAVKGSVDKYNPGGERTTLMLTRFVIAPDAPKNAASFLLGRSIRLIEQDGRFDFLITYADTFKGHTGAIYKATNWTYHQLSVPTPVWITADGQQLSRKYGGGGSYTHAEMQARGAVLVGYFAKHVFTMRLKIHNKPQARQLALAQEASVS